MFLCIQMLNLPPLAVSKSDARSERKTSKSMYLNEVEPDLAAHDEAWNCLGSLYQEMGKDDWLRVIRVGHIVKDPCSKKALEAVQSGRPALALSIYEQLLDTYDENDMRDSTVLDSETSIWYEDKMSCLESLGCWDVLHDQVRLTAFAAEKKQL